MNISSIKESEKNKKVIKIFISNCIQCFCSLYFDFNYYIYNIKCKYMRVIYNLCLTKLFLSIAKDKSMLNNVLSYQQPLFYNNEINSHH